MRLSRRSGLLLHPTSLPGPYGIGELGAEAHSWLRFLAGAGQRLWQVLPLGPTGFGDSPYQSFSSFAGNHLLVSMDELVRQGWVTAEELDPLVVLPQDRVEYGELIPTRLAALAAAAQRFYREASPADRAELAAFRMDNESWLPDYALFMALKEAFGGAAWNSWPDELRSREPAALERERSRLAPLVHKHEVWQFWFFEQWGRVRSEARELGVEVVGDLPIFVAFDSVDVWANPGLFYLTDEYAPSVVAGVPPDYFSVTGQRWGNPLYRWDVLGRGGFRWWVERVRANLRLFDVLRIDHFRGFAAYWEIPAAEGTAVKGRWVDGPGQALFDALSAELGELPLIAEDLGVITPDVDELREHNDLPGMRVLQFAFASDAADPYLPHNYEANTVVYTGTHDNDTTVGWYASAPAKEKDHVRRYLARGDKNVAWELWRLASASVADTAIAPLQDVLGLGSDARMNLPGSGGGNWGWRFSWEDVPYWVAPELREMVELYGRGEAAEAVDTVYRQSEA